jgi:hypothetical protein
MGKTNALHGKILSFQQQHNESVPEVWEHFQDYILECPHRGMENWPLMQTFYHGLTTSTHETMDVVARGAFLSLTIRDATALVEKMASNQGWNEESQIAQLASSVPPADKGKIPGQPEELETINLVDIFNEGWYYSDQPSGGWKDESLPEKKGDPGRPVIPIAIGLNTFEEGVCDFGASVNIMPKVIYKKIYRDPLLYTTMCLQLADQSLCYRPEGHP